jgi:hypothetical protein
MSDSTEPRPLPIAILRAILRAFVTIVVVAYTILDELLFPLFRPLVRWLGHLRLFEAVGTVIQRSPPYAVLVYLAVPFILVEPLKVFALYWGAVGHPFQGLVILVVAQILSIFTLDRIYHVGKAQLLQIGWVARLMRWLVGLRNRALAWAKSTAAWQTGAVMVRSLRLWFSGVLSSLRS